MFGDIGKMMKMLGQIKKNLPEMRQKMAESNFTAEVAAPQSQRGTTGAVRATVSGRGTLIDLRIDPEVLDRDDTPAQMAEMIEDLTAAAVKAAQEKASDAIKEAMNELTGGAELPPGLTDMM